MKSVERSAAEVWALHETGETVLLPLADIAFLFALTESEMMARGIETYIDADDGEALVTLEDLLSWMVRTGHRTKMGRA